MVIISNDGRLNWRTSRSCSVRAMIRWARAVCLVAFVAGCGGAVTAGGSANAPPPGQATAPANVELVDADSAVVGGQRVAFDGVREGLAWPALAKALGRREGDTQAVTIAVRREVPLANVVRA